MLSRLYCLELVPLRPVLMNIRRRPLRTYSKRATSSDSAEPPRKRQRTDEAAHDVRPMKSSRRSFQENGGSQPSLPPPSHAPTNPKRGTIMNYFKVVSPSSNNLSSSTEPSSCGAEPISTPPSSPPPKADIRPKKRRRLTTKVIPQDIETDEPAENKDPDNPSSEGDRPVPIPSDKEAAAGILTGTSASTLNKATAPSQQRSEAGKRGKSHKGPSVKSATVQTTLSLSMSDQGFTECKECNMLYNPYHVKDAKIHAKRHAAILKTKSKSKASDETA